jgi:hypothetical protein
MRKIKIIELSNLEILERLATIVFMHETEYVTPKYVSEILGIDENYFLKHIMKDYNISLYDKRDIMDLAMTLPCPVGAQVWNYILKVNGIVTRINETEVNYF